MAQALLGRARLSRRKGESAFPSLPGGAFYATATAAAGLGYGREQRPGTRYRCRYSPAAGAPLPVLPALARSLLKSPRGCISGGCFGRYLKPVLQRCALRHLRVSMEIEWGCKQSPRSPVTDALDFSPGIQDTAFCKGGTLCVPRDNGDCRAIIGH